MKRLPRAMFSIILYLTVIYNLERITINKVGLIDIKGFVYALIIISILIILQWKAVRNLPIASLLIASLIIYAIGKFGWFLDWTAWDQNAIYLIITEIMLLWLGILLAYRAGGYMDDFEEAVTNITFSGLERTRDLKKTTDDIQVEMYRSRRYNHPLTMVVIEPETIPMDTEMNIAIKEVQQSMVERYYAINMARAIYNDLRLVDMVIDLDHGKRFAILYPETPHDKALPLVGRIYEVAKEMGITIRAGMASFPEDAITFEELLKKSTSDLGMRDVPAFKLTKTAPFTLEKEGEEKEGEEE